jgi:autoinducer 2-degrading protein
MTIRIIDVHVREADVEAFKTESRKNHQGSIREPGVLRFDVLQDEADGSHFMLVEAYRDEQAVLDHKDTPHYRGWRDAVAPMMARARVGSAYSPVAPLEPEQWKL